MSWAPFRERRHPLLGFLTLLSLFLSGALSCSEERCAAGDPCDESCLPGEVPLCVADGICNCVPESFTQPDGGAAGAGGEGGGAPIPAECRAPAPEELLINEVLINPAGSDGGQEFIELVNVSDAALALNGIQVNVDGEGKVRLTGGCIAAQGAVAVFDDESSWLWSPEPLAAPIVDVSSLSLVNSRPFSLSLIGINGAELSRFEGPEALIKDGVSATRSPDPGGALIVLHDELSELKSSPAGCAIGGVYSDGCAGGSGGAGGAAGAGGDGGAGGAGGGHSCPTPFTGELVINEVLTNPEGADGDQEFIELVNLVDSPLSLDGLELRLIEGDEEGDVKVAFEVGCIPSLGVVALYDDEAAHIWRPVPAAPVSFTRVDLSLINSRPFSLALISSEGDLIDFFEGQSFEDANQHEGVSVTRNPDPGGIGYALHDLVSHEDSSPARCGNGGSYEALCEDGAGGEGGTGGTGGAGGTAGMGAMGGMAGIGGEGGAGGTPPPNCRAPAIGELIINEVLIDAEGPEPAGEFVELLNLSAEPLSLAGLRLEEGPDTVTFEAGCIPGLGAVAIYGGPVESWRWSLPPEGLSAGGRLQLANGSENTITLSRGDGTELSVFVLRSPGSGESVNRNPDGQPDGAATPHSELSFTGLIQSPAACVDGGLYHEGCR